MGGAAPISSPRMEPTLKITGFKFGTPYVSETLVTMADVVEHLKHPDCDAVWIRNGRRKATILGAMNDGSVTVNVEGPGRDASSFRQFTDPLMAAFYAASEVRSH
jgi:hypothetical protein